MGEVFELMDKKKKSKETDKTVKIDKYAELKEEIENLKADIAWLQRQISELKTRKR